VLQRCYTGIEIRDDVLYLHPCLPQELTMLHLDMRYCGQSLAVDITSDRLTIRALPGAAQAITICACGVLHRLDVGETKEFRL
jgi:trehalose/maltose hydrolase-like predicted phosphorylase